jgi:hypothetical protein
MNRVGNIKHMEIHIAKPLVHVASPLEVEIDIAKFKCINRQV